MSTTKTALKAAKSALDSKKYDEAIEQAKIVLNADPKSYHGNVFLGLAYDKQNLDDKSENAYQAAIRTKDNDPLAWQGLISLYEKQNDRKIGEYHDAALQLAGIFMDTDDKTRCQTVTDKYVDFARTYGSRSQYKHALSILLPTSPVYDYLEGRILHPPYTYTKIAGIIEDEEKEEINREIGQRRTRLGARVDQVTAEVKREVLQKSPLENLYQSIINWSNDDESRRQYEEKILQRAYDTLTILPQQDKEGKRDQVRKFAQGLVILKHPFALAWSIVLEWNDVESVDQLDVGLLREYIEFFPEDGLSKVLRGYLGSDISPFPQPSETQGATEEQKDTEIDHSAVATTEDRLLLMTEGLEESTSSVLARRLIGDYYLYLEEYASAADTVRKALRLVSTASANTGLPFQNIADALNIILATSLVQYQAPRHHPEARDLFDQILNRKETNTSALIGVGLILEEEGQYAEAIAFLNRALERSSDTKIRAEAAWCKALNGDYGSGLQELEACLPNLKGSETAMKGLRAQTLYRIGICLWTLDSSKAARKDRDGAYGRFLASIQADMNFAPAYTSLGVYYADYAKDKRRARKCFQKAFELSSSEVEAAERLARGFAKDREWDLVEVVAQRVVESGKVKPAPGSKKKGVSWPFAALGVVQLNNQEYAKSIVSFQSALRTSPEDYHCWVGLGESYHNSGRYIAATKAFEQAQKIEKDPRFASAEESWFSEYMLANVKRELGEYGAASHGYREVLATRPKEFGVSIALLQTLVEGAWHDLELGFYGRASKGAAGSIKIAQDIANEHDQAFNLWKAVGDVCSIYSWVEESAGEAPILDLRDLLKAGIDLEKYDVLAEVDQVGKDALTDMSRNYNSGSTQSICIQVAILAQKRAIATSANDIHARAVAWYNLGWTEYRAHVIALQHQQRDATKKKTLQYLKACVQCFKRAIELEAGNADFWNALGIVTTEMNPKVAQHAFIRSLYLNDKSARVWTNLGTLYLLQNDIQLASEAFTRAQSTDPNYAHAWLAQGLLAQLLGESSEAENLFTHAFEIADSSSILVKRQYALSTFDHVLQSSTASQNLADLLQPLLAVRQLRQQTSSDTAFQHLLALFAERAGDHITALRELEDLCAKLEADYESSESTLMLVRFAQAKGDLGRAQLAEGSFEAAIENTQTALDLTGEEGIEEAVRQKIRLSAHLTAGLASYYQNSMDQAVDMFRSALQETQDDPDIICLLAQVLWAKGGEEEQNVAREQLFDCVEKHPGHFGAITLLGAIAVLDNDTDTIEAVSDDLRGLRTRDDLSSQQKLKVAQLMTALAAASSGDQGQESSEMLQAQTAVMLAPSQPHGWIELAALVEDPHPAEMGVLTARRSVPPVGSLDAEDLGKAYAETNRLDDAQRSVMVAPWVATGWQALA